MIGLWRHIKARPLPEGSLLGRYDEMPGTYTDCFETRIPGRTTQAEFIIAFYTTRLFAAERFILRLFLRKGGTDEDARALAQAQRDTFAVWTVEDRTNDQILLRDIYGRTCSWLALVEHQGATLLRFGSAVLPKPGGDPHRPGLGWIGTAFLPFHRLYARALLGACRAKLLSSAPQDYRDAT